MNDWIKISEQEPPEGEKKAYIGEVLGLSEEWDIRRLATVKDLGAKFPYEQAKEIIRSQGQKLDIEY